MVTFDGKAVALLMGLGRGWEVLQKDHPQLVRVALYAIRLTVCLDQSHRRGAGHLTLKELGILSTIFQHELYNLEPTPRRRFEIPILYSILCGLLFKATVTSSSSLTRKCIMPKTVYVENFWEALRDYFETSTPRIDQYRTLVLWAVVMGTMVAEPGYQRDWYLQRMIGLVVQSGLCWDSFKILYGTFPLVGLYVRRPSQGYLG